LADAQLEKMTGLIRETIGYSKERGDSVNLMNTPFATEKLVMENVAFWKQAEFQDLARSFAWPVGTFLFGALVLMGAIRPAIKTLGGPVIRMPQVANRLDAIEAEEPERPKLVVPKKIVEIAGPTASEMALDDARKLTRDNPAAVANIVKSWINAETNA
jgi:flagellar M-ring protein FliF